MSFPRFPFLLVLLLVTLLSTSAVAFAGNPNHYRYTTRDGLAGDYITAITLAPDGSAWIGTTEGATHIEKERWTSYTRAHGLGDSWITAIALAPDGRVWFGTQSRGVSVFDPNAKTITTYNLDNSKIPSNFVTTLAVDAQNQVWIGTLNNGIAVFNASTASWTNDLANTEISSFAFGAEKTPWLISNRSLYYFDKAAWTRTEIRGAGQIKKLRTRDGLLLAETHEGVYRNDGGEWFQLPATNETLVQDTVLPNDTQLTAYAIPEKGNALWLGTANGLYAVDAGIQVPRPTPFPVVLVHGWTVAGDDTLETSEFRFLKSYADRDGIPMFYARGVSPKKTLYENAVTIRREIARIKKETGADKVNVIAFSMGGMNTRAYLESSLYANDVNRAIILGTPQAGVEIWKPILIQQILEKFDEPSAIELSPEYARLIVNQTRAPNPKVVYDLLIGDAREQVGLDFLQDMPASDALISVHSALALDAPNVHKHINTDLHDWGPEPLPIDLTSYLYPRETWERYLRNALRDRDNAPIGSEIASPPDESSRRLLGSRGVRSEEGSNHTPVVTRTIYAGETVTNTVLIDENKSTRFIAYFPGGALDFSLVAPDGKKFEPNDLPRADDSGALSLSTDVANFSGYVIKNAGVGEWQMILTRTDGGGEPIQVSTYAELNAPRTLNAFTRWQTIALAATNTITGSVRMDSGDTARDVKMTARIAQPSEELGAPFTLTELELFDDGKHNDGAANDGYFANDFSATRAGWHLVFVQARGENFARESETLFTVSPNDAQITSLSTLTQQQEQLLLNARVNAQRVGAYALSAALTNIANGRVIAKTFMPLNLKVGTNQIPIIYDLSRLERGQFAVEVILLDARGAALEMDRATLLAPRNPVP